MDTASQKGLAGWNDHRITRRQCSQMLLTVGMLGAGLGSMLSACTQQPANLYWHSEDDENHSFQYLSRKFNETHPDIQIQQMRLSPGSPYNPHDDVMNHIKSDQYRPDVISLDVVWMKEFATNGWLEPLDRYWQPIQDRANYLPNALQAVNFDGHIWAAPLHTDVGVLFYRTDIVKTAPTTWDELKSLSLEATRSGKAAYGYVWQGIKTEALMCNFVEVLSSFGGHLFDPHDPKKVTIYHPEAVQALQTMIDWIHGPQAISPLQVLGYDESGSNTTWNNGKAVFMRNWPSHIFWSNDAQQSKIAEQFNVTALPAGSTSTRACLGGWQLGINAFSPHKDDAWTFIKWMLEKDAQQYLAVKETFPVTLKDIYNDQYIDDFNPFFKKIPDILRTAQNRPQLVNYPQVANAIQQYVYLAIQQPKIYPADMALKLLQGQLEQIMHQSK
ncbi:ABC transporter substrate-binding protein [Dictyobacter arantiisoli]|uniref:ABC transporter-binding protein n=1 Tax=Dictyobacter arantiisoli TaxID=2014874 RepID=A0A5A5T847_9CHLR|nr:ABC transporter substrate-binding protein [Dictyobacter arantiisoli]GCF07578.1 hypothetical protein KDI_11420 [Dictyobacter arantiisoli]